MLLSKGIADAEVERCLREYSGKPPKNEPQEKPESQDAEKSNTPHPPSVGGNESPAEGNPQTGPRAKRQRKNHNHRIPENNLFDLKTPERSSMFSAARLWGKVGTVAVVEVEERDRKVARLRIRKRQIWRRRAEPLRHANLKVWVSQSRRCHKAIPVSIFGRRRTGMSFALRSRLMAAGQPS